MLWRATAVAALLAIGSSSNAQTAQRGAARADTARTVAAPRDSGPRAPRRATTLCTVARVIDGDTIECRENSTRVRLIGIDAPESNQRPFGDAARTALAALLPAGTRAQLERDVDATDRYGRTLSYVWAGGAMINWTMIRNGWVVLLTIAPNVQYVDTLRTAEQKARAERRGLWAQNGFACAPAEHRRGRC